MVKPIFLSFVFFALLAIPPTDTSKCPFSLAVVPSTSHGEGGSITMAANERRDFYVVLTNVSKDPQAVWENWNSWGYQTISFALTMADGSKIMVSKRQQDFTRNFPSTFLIQPGEHQVYAIRLDKEWSVHPTFSKIDEMRITLKAVYEVSPTPEAGQYKVWTGRVESSSYKFMLRQW
jgi:hypothetical protein